LRVWGHLAQLEDGKRLLRTIVVVLLFRVQGSGFRVQGSGFRVWGSGFGVQGLGPELRVPGSGFRVQD